MIIFDIPQSYKPAAINNMEIWLKKHLKPLQDEGLLENGIDIHKLAGAFLFCTEKDVIEVIKLARTNHIKRKTYEIYAYVINNKMSVASFLATSKITFDDLAFQKFVYKKQLVPAKL